MKTIEQIELEINFPQHYRELALKYNNQKEWHWAKPKKEDMLRIFKELGYAVKYVSIDRIFIEKHPAGKYNFEYYFEFNGTSPSIYIYIKTTDNKNWVVQRYIPGLGIVKKLYPNNDANSFIGYSFLTANLTEIEQFFKDAKPILDDLRKEIVYHLNQDSLDFTVT